jgi:hypothetical protein
MRALVPIPYRYGTEIYQSPDSWKHIGKTASAVPLQGGFNVTPAGYAAMLQVLCSMAEEGVCVFTCPCSEQDMVRTAQEAFCRLVLSGAGHARNAMAIDAAMRLVLCITRPA